MQATLDSNASFSDLGVSEPLIKGLIQQGFKHPTALQRQVLPPVLDGRDLLLEAGSGGGRTAACGLPVLQRIDPGQPFAGLVLTARKEIAADVATFLRNLARRTEVRVTGVGGQRPRSIAEKLERNPQVVAGTPGGIMGLNRKGLVPVDGVSVVLIAEMDRMLDHLFRESIRELFALMPKSRQVICVAGTLNDDIEAFAEHHMRDPVRISVGASGGVAVGVSAGASGPGGGGTATARQTESPAISHGHFEVQPWDKIRLLAHLLRREAAVPTLVFCRDAGTVRDQLDGRSRGDGTVVHFVTDGTDHDVSGIRRIIGFDLPADPADYARRADRLDGAGSSWSFVGPDEKDRLRDIEKAAGLRIALTDTPQFEPAPAPGPARTPAPATPPDPVAAKPAPAATRNLPTPAARTPPVPAEQDDTKYPGGLVPVAPPRKRLGGRTRTRGGK